MGVGPLDGFRIGVTADRRAEEQIQLLTGRGARCLHGPMLRTQPLGAQSPLRAATERVIAEPPDVVVATTGIGLRAWLEAAQAMDVADDLFAVLDAGQLLARGPKASGALVAAGLTPGWTAPTARNDEIVRRLVTEGGSGRRVAVQLDGAHDLHDPWAPLETAGITVIRVPVYRWTRPADPEPARRLIRAVAGRRLNGVTFTARPAVDAFFELARAEGLDEQVADALRGPVTPFCVGAVCAEGFADRRLPEPVVPERARLGALVQMVVRELGGRGEEVTLGDVRLTLRGDQLSTASGVTVSLAPGERTIFRALIARPGAVVAKAALTRRGERDDPRTSEHAVEAAIGRLRRRLRPTGLTVVNVFRRGYRLAPSSER